MSRVKRGVTAKARHKKTLKLAKGYRGARSRTFKVAKQAVTRAGQYAYRDRRVKKRTFRSLWIVRINAAVRANGLSYRHTASYKPIQPIGEIHEVDDRGHGKHHQRPTQPWP